MSQRDDQTSKFWENYNQTVVYAPKPIITYIFCQIHYNAQLSLLAINFKAQYTSTLKIPHDRQDQVNESVVDASHKLLLDASSADELIANLDLEAIQASCF